MVWGAAPRTAAAGTHGRWGFQPGVLRRAGSVRRGTAVPPAWRGSCSGAGSTCSERESPASSETWHQLPLTYLRQDLQAGWEEPPVLHPPPALNHPGAAPELDAPSLLPHATLPRSQRALAHPGFGTIPVLWCHSGDFTATTLLTTGLAFVVEAGLLSPSPRPCSLPAAAHPNLHFTKLQRLLLGLLGANTSHPGASVSLPGWRRLYRSTEVISMPPLRHRK